MKAAIDADILVVQEFTDIAQLEIIAEKMGYDHYAASNFVTNYTTQRRSFEVGVLSDYEISRTIEYDPSPDEGSEDLLEERKLYPLLEGSVGFAGSRGFLWVEFDDLDLVVIGVHLKSSSGSKGYADYANAVKREAVAYAIADKIANELLEDQTTTYLVAGDFNVGHSDEDKNGIDPSVECYDDRDCTFDGYDENPCHFRRWYCQWIGDEKFMRAHNQYNLSRI